MLSSNEPQVFGLLIHLVLLFINAAAYSLDTEERWQTRPGRVCTRNLLAVSVFFRVPRILCHAYGILYLVRIWKVDWLIGSNWPHRNYFRLIPVFSFVQSVESVAFLVFAVWQTESRFCKRIIIPELKGYYIYLLASWSFRG